MTAFAKLVQRFGWCGVPRLLFYPVTALLTTPVRLIQTLWACRIFADGRWGDYLGFTPRRALTDLFYWTRALNLYRFGRSGVSPYLGLGDYRLARCFHYSLPSLYWFWNAGNVTVLIGLFGWLASHLFWLEAQSVGWVIVVLLLALASTTFYSNAFCDQQYNALGWAFFPLGLYGLATGNWLLAGIAWVAVSLGSFTATVLAGIVAVAYSLGHLTVTPVLTLLPAGAKLVTHFWPLAQHGAARGTLIGVMKAIGIVRRSAKYKRTTSMTFKILHLAYLTMWAQFLIATFWLTGELHLDYAAAMAFYLINGRVARFADHQSFVMLMFSLTTATIMQHPDPRLLVSYWLAVTPLPKFTGFGHMQQVLDVVPKLAPFSIRPFLDGMQKFLSPVAPGQRVLLAFDNPGNVYENVYSGYRTLVELPLYVAAMKEVHLFPDWWAVFELNYEGAPEPWGTDLESVTKNVREWHADYVLLHQTDKTEFEDGWRQAGFELLGTFRWSDYESQLGRGKPFAGPAPTWRLLKYTAPAIKAPVE